MKFKLMVAGLLMTASLGGAAQAGCVTGAMAGGVAGHFAGRHTLLGAAAGCAVGHHMSVMKHRRERAAAQQAAMAQGQVVQQAPR